MLAMLYLPRKALFFLLHREYTAQIAARLVEYLVLPSATWLILASMAFLWAGSRQLAYRRDPDKSAS
jgi:hypothetical protein